MSRITIPLKLREEITKRDIGVCQCCGVVSISEIHHIIPICYGGTDELDNLIGLCHTCHEYAPDDKESFAEYRKKGGMGLSIALSNAFLSTNLPPHIVFEQAMKFINTLRKIAIDNGIEKYGLPLEDLEFIKKKKREEVKNAKITRNKRKILYNLASELGQAEEVVKEPGVILDIQ